MHGTDEHHSPHGGIKDTTYRWRPTQMLFKFLFAVRWCEDCNTFRLLICGVLNKFGPNLAPSIASFIIMKLIENPYSYHSKIQKLLYILLMHTAGPLRVTDRL